MGKGGVSVEMGSVQLIGGERATECGAPMESSEVSRVHLKGGCKGGSGAIGRGVLDVVSRSSGVAPVGMAVPVRQVWPPAPLHAGHGMHQAEDGDA